MRNDMPCGVTDGPEFEDDEWQEPDLEALTEHAEYMAELRREDDERLDNVLRNIAVIRRVDMLSDQAN